MTRLNAFVVFLMGLSQAFCQQSSLQCSTASGSHEECTLRYISDKLEQISSLDRKIDNAVQKISEQIQSGTEQIHSNSDFSCPESPDNAATDASLPENCLDLYNKGHRTSGIYTVYEPFGISPFRPNQRRAITVFCDMEVANGGPGWMYIQRRQDGSVRFNRTWTEYRSGFGDIAGENWLGNDNIAIITGASTAYELRIDLMDWEGERRYAEYSWFKVQPESFKYTLSFGSYSGNAGDSMTQEHNNSQFSTHDMSYNYCPTRYHAGWWYGSCFEAGLNHRYHNSSPISNHQGIIWRFWHGYDYSLKQVSMKLRPFIP